MFGNFKKMQQQMSMMQKLMKDDNFKAFMSHPKVQAVFQDPEFQAIAKSQDMNKMISHPKFAALLQDPEILEAMAKLKPGNQGEAQQ